MRNFLGLALSALALFTTLPSGNAFAREMASQPQEQSAHGRLFDVLTSDPDNLVAARATEISVGYMVSANPLFAEVEAENPGFLRELQQALIPVFSRYLPRVRADQRGNFIASVRDLVTEEEAAEVARFYESDLGQRILRTASQNVQIAATTEEMLSEDPFTTEDAVRDVSATSRATINNLSAADLTAIERHMRANPHIARNIQLMQEPLLRVRVAMDNAPMLPREEADLAGAMEDVLSRYGLSLNGK